MRDSCLLMVVETFEDWKQNYFESERIWLSVRDVTWQCHGNRHWWRPFRGRGRLLTYLLTAWRVPWQSEVWVELKLPIKKIISTAECWPVTLYFSSSSSPSLSIRRNGCFEVFHEWTKVVLQLRHRFDSSTTRLNSVRHSTEMSMFILFKFNHVWEVSSPDNELQFDVQSPFRIASGSYRVDICYEPTISYK